VTKADLQEGQMLLESRMPRHANDPIATGWKREGDWLIGLVMWRAGKGYRMIEQGKERA
jgi:hypothetical protein